MVSRLFILSAWVLLSAAAQSSRALGAPAIPDSHHMKERRRSCVLSFDHLFDSPEKLSPALQKILKSPALSSWTRAKDPGYRKIFELVATAGEKKNRLNLFSDTFKFEGDVALQQGQLNISLDLVQAFETDSRGKKRVMMLGARPQGTNSTLSSVLGAVFEGLQEATKRNPNVSSVRFTVSCVENWGLQEMLKKIGFQSREIRSEGEYYVEYPDGEVYDAYDWILDLKIRK